MAKDKGKIINGNMTNNMEDVIWLGKQMENLRDGQELAEDDRIADPVQFDQYDSSPIQQDNQ
ncbi:multidrug ABC transporter ATPase [Lysinibacillus sp. 54212]|uniref:multidrug ABC transporter ATPase n=1 Tax=Lysinibacillus sp. 54212 TaxID=3119829 RepID=UPI002FCAE13A